MRVTGAHVLGDSPGGHGGGDPNPNPKPNPKPKPKPNPNPNQAHAADLLERRTQSAATRHALPRELLSNTLSVRPPVTLPARLSGTLPSRAAILARP